MPRLFFVLEDAKPAQLVDNSHKNNELKIIHITAVSDCCSTCVHTHPRGPGFLGIYF